MSDEPLRILHLSDTHLFGDDSLHYGVVDTLAALERVLERAAGLDAVDVIVASGDLSEDGTAEAYRRLRERLDTFAAPRGARVVYAMGNHDVREPFEAELGARWGAFDARGFRVVHLDSSVPGAGYGLVAAEQLEWLGRELATPSAHGTVLVLHHPPVAATTTLLQALELQNPGELMDVLGAGDVRIVLCGHYHHPLVSSARGIPVSVAPGITNTSDVLAPVGTETWVVGSGFGLVEVPAEGAPRITTVWAPGPDDGAVALALDEEGVRRIAEKAGA